MAQASADIDATGMNDAHLFSSSDGDISGTAVINATVNSHQHWYGKRDPKAIKHMLLETLMLKASPN